jgi:hypothetical protein
MQEDLKEIEVKRYGKHGYGPKDKGLCVYKGENMCVGIGESNLCGGYMGIKKILGREFVLCAGEIGRISN